MPSMIFKKVRSASRSDDGAVKIELFRDEQDRVCGWFLGPVRLEGDGVRLPYLPRSARARASVAVIRAIEASEYANVPLCLIDPDDLWASTWQGERG